MIAPDKESVGAVGAAGAAVLFIVLWISKLMRTWTGDRSAEQQDKSSSALLTHYEERVETLAKKCDELVEQNTKLMADNASLRTEMEQLRMQLATFGALLDYCLHTDGASNTPPAELMKKLACMITAAGKADQEACGGGK